MRYLKIIILAFVILFGFDAFAQKDTIFLKGDGRRYADSIVLRWNTTDANSFYKLYAHAITIQRKTENTADFETISTPVSVAPEKWGINQKTTNQSLLLAAGSMYNLPALFNAIYIDVNKQIEQNEMANFYWANISLSADLNPEVASYCNLRYCDKTAPKNQEVFYRIFVNSNDFVSDTLYFIVPEQAYIFEKTAIEEAKENEQNVTIIWQASKKYSAYYVEKSLTQTGKFDNINKVPIVVPVNQGETPQLQWKDSVANYKSYYYRIYGVDMFGNHSLPSEPILAQGRDRTPPAMPKGVKIIELKNSELRISWNNVGTKEGIRGCALGLKHENEETYKPITKLMAPTETSFIYKINPNQTDYYFIVQFFDTAGNSSITPAFYQLVDSTPPAKPTGFKAIVDKKGVVTLSWNWNTESDLDGYLIYFANSLKAEKSGIVNRPLLDTLFYDTLSLGMLNKDVYYQIQAVDKRFNRSAYSEVIKVQRPDTLPPVAPIIKNYKITDSSITLVWVPSSSVDVQNHQLNRKHIKTGITKTIQVKADTLYVDKDINNNELYTYYFSAIDDSKNVSPSSNEVSLQTFKNYYKDEVKLFTALYDSTKNEVQLYWTYPIKNMKKIDIYKGISMNAVSIAPIEINVNQNWVIDVKVKPNTLYYYAIKIYLNDGTQTKLSVPIGLFTGN